VRGVEPKEPSTARPRSRRNNALLRAVVIIAILGSPSIACKNHPAASSTNSTSPQAETTPQPAIRAGRSGAARVACPPFGSYVVPSPQSQTGHRVVLSWKASSPADSKHSAAIGYCIYRGTEPNRIAERINLLPFAGTRCADDSVEEGKKYYYEVRAITAEGITSTTSTHATASIPGHAATAEVPADAPRLCRESP